MAVVAPIASIGRWFNRRYLVQYTEDISGILERNVRQQPPPGPDRTDDAESQRIYEKATQLRYEIEKIGKQLIKDALDDIRNLGPKPR